MNNIEQGLRDQIDVMQQENKELKDMIKEYEEIVDDKNTEITDLKNAIKDIEFITNNI